MIKRILKFFQPKPKILTMGITPDIYARMEQAYANQKAQLEVEKILWETLIAHVEKEKE